MLRLEVLRRTGRKDFPAPHEKIWINAPSLELSSKHQPQPFRLRPVECGLLIATLRQPQDLTTYQQIFNFLSELIPGKGYSELSSGALLTTHASSLRGRLRELFEWEEYKLRPILGHEVNRGYFLFP